MGLRHISDYVYNAMAEKSLRIFIRLKKLANITTVSESINIYIIRAIIKRKCQTSRSLCVYIYVQISDLLNLDSILWRLCDSWYRLSHSFICWPDKVSWYLWLLIFHLLTSVPLTRCSLKFYIVLKAVISFTLVYRRKSKPLKVKFYLWKVKSGKST